MNYKYILNALIGLAGLIIGFVFGSKWFGPIFGWNVPVVGELYSNTNMDQQIFENPKYGNAKGGIDETLFKNPIYGTGNEPILGSPILRIPAMENPRPPFANGFGEQDELSCLACNGNKGLTRGVTSARRQALKKKNH